LRISIKKLRYSGELLAPLFAAKASKKFLARLVGLQDVLGELNDAATATRLIDQLASMNDDPAYLQILCYLRGYAAARSHFSSGAFAAAWKPFIAAEPYW
jgi:triphosphatase